MNITKELSELGLYNIKIEEDNKIFEMIFAVMEIYIGV